MTALRPAPDLPDEPRIRLPLNTVVLAYENVPEPVKFGEPAVVLAFHPSVVTPLYSGYEPLARSHM